MLAAMESTGVAQVNLRVQRHRAALRKAGLRPIQIWVPDTRRPDFADECRRQCHLVSEADAADEGLARLIDEALTEVDGWAK